ncbi:hypothetical protein ACFU96_47405 [Streptomyces sp. NPDC057620]|uniref:hypothetical protein n=1 Tax=Streptomyces sp. NPDC057620 TaxID=3346185 RepID=UPI0036CB547A
MAGRVLVAFSRMRSHPGIFPRQEVDDEAQHFAGLLLAVYDDAGQLTDMLGEQCLVATARV